LVYVTRFSPRATGLRLSLLGHQPRRSFLSISAGYVKLGAATSLIAWRALC
jgi:hypothetical protein